MATSAFWSRGRLSEIMDEEHVHYQSKARHRCEKRVCGYRYREAAPTLRITLG